LRRNSQNNKRFGSEPTKSAPKATDCVGGNLLFLAMGKVLLVKIILNKKLMNKIMYNPPSFIFYILTQKIVKVMVGEGKGKKF